MDTDLFCSVPHVILVMNGFIPPEYFGKLEGIRI